MKWSLGLGLFHSAQVTRNVELTSGAAGQTGGGAHCVDYARIMETPSLFQGSEVLDMVTVTLCYSLYAWDGARGGLDGARMAVDVFRVLFNRRVGLPKSLMQEVVGTMLTLMPSSPQDL